MGVSQQFIEASGAVKDCTCSRCNTKRFKHAPLRQESKSESVGLRTILHEALDITGTGGERNDSYDHPHPNFSKIAAVWTTLLSAKLREGAQITPEEVANLMIGMKLVRQAHKHKRDNLVDIAGYARCIERLDEWGVGGLGSITEVDKNGKPI